MGSSFCSLLGWSHSTVPRQALEFEFRVQVLLLICLQAHQQGESPADAGGVRREGCPAPQPKAGNRTYEGPEF